MKVQDVSYMAQYARFGNLCQNSQNFQNFNLPGIFIVRHHASSYIHLQILVLHWGVIG